jgi:hypothetical protein
VRKAVKSQKRLLIGWTVAAGTSLGLAIAGHVLQIVWPAEDDEPAEDQLGEGLPFSGLEHKA